MVSHGFGLSLVPAMLPRIEDTFESGYGALGLAIASGLIAYAFGALMTSKVMKLVPTRAVLVGTFALSTAGFLVTTAAASPASIALSVVLLGISAPISWTATIHVARESVSASSMSLVSAGASGGAAVGVIVNGVLVRTSDTLHSWRVNRPIAKPTPSGAKLMPLFAKVLRNPSGRLVVATSAVSGVAVFTLATFLTATAIDEMGVSAGAAAALLWIAGTVGVVAAIAFGRLGDNRTPSYAIRLAMAGYAVSLILLTIGWSYLFLVVAVIGYGILNGPVWGLMGALANRRFAPEPAVGAIALGLVAASLVGAVGNSAAGLWIESTGSMQLPVAVLAVMTSALTLYLTRHVRNASRETLPGRADA
jgi:predicted MFS family arabinose efflux permease